MILSKQGKQVIYLYGSTVLGLLVGIFISVLNTRSLTPSDYGDVRYVTNLILFLSGFLLFGYFISGSRLLAVSKTERESRRIRGVMVVMLGVASGVLFLATLLAAFVHNLWMDPKVGSLLLITSLVCFQPLLLNYVNTTAQGDNHILRLSAARVLPSMLYLGIAVYAYSRWGATSQRMLLLQNGISCIVLCCIIFSTRPTFRGLSETLVHLKEENKLYGFQCYLGSLVFVAVGGLAGITLGIFNEDNTQVGFFILAVMLAAPLQMLPSIIGTAYFKEFAKQSAIPLRVLKWTIAVSVFSLVSFILVVRFVVDLLYDESYAVVSGYASFLAVGMTLHGVGDMINRFLGSHGQGRAIRNSSVWPGLVLLFGYVVFVYFWDIQGAIATRILSDLFYVGMISFYYVRFVNAGSER